MDRVSMSGNVQGSVDKNSSAPPWRDMGQWTEFPCPEMCRGPWVKKLRCPSLEGYGPMDRVPMSRNVQGSIDKKTPVPLPGGIWANRQSSHVQKCAGVHG